MDNLEVISLLVLCLLFGIRSTPAIPQGCEWLAGHYAGKDVTLTGMKCDGANLMEIPLDHRSTSANYLEIQQDSIENLTVSSLEKYGKLQYLSLKFAGVHTIEEGALSSLKKLVHVDLTGNHITELPTLPDTVETLTLDHMERGFFNSPNTIDRITALGSLKKLLMRSNRLRSLPPFVSEISSLTDVFVDINDIVQLNVRQIAPLCNLKSFSFSRNKINSGFKEACQCQYVRKWSTTKGIEMRNLSCPVVIGSDDEKCKAHSKDDFDAAEDEYARCRTNETRGILKTCAYSILGIILFLAVWMCYCWCGKRKTADAARTVYNHDGGEDVLESFQKSKIEVVNNEQLKHRKKKGERNGNYVIFFRF